MKPTQETINQIDASKRFGVSDRTLRRWERKGLIRGKRIGGIKLYPIHKLREIAGVLEAEWQR